MTDAAAPVGAPPGPVVPAPREGDRRFVDAHRPALSAGDYDVSVSQVITRTVPVAKTETAPATTATEPVATYRPVTRRLRVAAPRFALSPELVVSVFPPAGSSGAYGAVLPHVVLGRKTLPWERSGAVGGDLDDTDDRLDADGRPVSDLPPWLALLVFHPDDRGDAPGEGGAAPWEARPMTVGQLLAEDPGVLTYRWAETDDLDAPCSVIELPAALWARVAPTWRDARWLAHARESFGDQALAQSVVVANRLPAEAECVVHLVSIEGLGPEDASVAGAPDADALQRPVEGGVVRLASLASWRFTSDDPDDTFLELLTGLDVGPLRRPRSAPLAAAALRAAATVAVSGLPVAVDRRPGLAAEAAATAGLLARVAAGDGAVVAPASEDSSSLVEAAAAQGYGARRHRVRDGGRTVSWWRGPLVPLRPLPAPGVDAAEAIAAAVEADDLLRVDPTTGMLDTSLAVAWQLGQLLLLAEPEVAGQLARWRHDRAQALANAHDLAALGKVAGLFALDHPPTASGSSTTAPGDGVAGLAPPPAVDRWFERLALLEQVPDGHLLPGADALPDRSLRFFGVDPWWVESLVAGALSVGRPGSAQAEGTAVLRPMLGRRRHPTTGERSSVVPGSAGPITGFLLRSSVVTGWPGLRVTATDGSTGLALLRREVIAPGVLLCLFDGSLTDLVTAEPPEELHFGFVDATGDLASYDKALRDPADGTTFPRSEVGAAVIEPHVDDDTRRVAVHRLAGDLLGRRDALVADRRAAAGLPAVAAGAHTSADLALQLVEGAESVAFPAKATVAAPPSPAPGTDQEQES